MYCKHCGKEVNAQAAVCLSCGVAVGQGSTYCAHCGAQPDPLAVVCVKCGSPIKKVNNQRKKPFGTTAGISFGKAISIGWKKYADFEGRATRSEYWYWVLFYILCFYPTLGIGAVVLFIPSIAVAVRRLHDIGMSGWWYLLGLVPLIGWIFLIIWYCTPSQEGENEYGPEPDAL